MNKLEKQLDRKGFHTVRLGRSSVKALDSRSGFDTVVDRCVNGEFLMTDINKDTGKQVEGVYFASIDEWYKTLIK